MYITRIIKILLQPNQHKIKWPNPLGKGYNNSTRPKNKQIKLKHTILNKLYRLLNPYYDYLVCLIY